MPEGTPREPASTVLRNAVVLVVVAAAAVLAIVRFDAVLAALSAIWSVVAPLLAGAAIAYLLNLIMERLERVYFPTSTHVVVKKTCRPVCLICSIALVALFVFVVVQIVSDEFATAVPALGDGVLTLLDMLNAWLTSGVLGNTEAVEYLSALLTGDSGAWEESLATLTDYVSEAIENFGGYSSLVSIAYSAGKGVVAIVVDTLVAIVFAIYLLAGKERALKGLESFLRWALSKRMYRRVAHVGQVANECFSRFIFGQCLEGTILGTLCAIGMKILGMPYCATIGLCVGVTSLVPLVGAWCGGIVGALMIMSVDPIQAVWFVIFLVCLQQVEGHVIYPNVVGTSVGVPSIWVLVAVFAGGSLFGILGIVLGVPTVATILALVGERGEGYRGKHDHEEADGAQAGAVGAGAQPTEELPEGDGAAAGVSAPEGMQPESTETPAG